MQIRTFFSSVEIIQTNIRIWAKIVVAKSDKHKHTSNFFYLDVIFANLSLCHFLNSFYTKLSSHCTNRLSEGFFLNVKIHSEFLIKIKCFFFLRNTIIKFAFFLKFKIAKINHITYQPQFVSKRKSFPLKHFTSSWWCLSHQYHSIFFTFSRVNRTNKNKIEVVQA